MCDVEAAGSCNKILQSDYIPIQVYKMLLSDKNWCTCFTMILTS